MQRARDMLEFVRESFPLSMDHIAILKEQVRYPAGGGRPGARPYRTRLQKISFEARLKHIAIAPDGKSVLMTGTKLDVASAKLMIDTISSVRHRTRKMQRDEHKLRSKIEEIENSYGNSYGMGNIAPSYDSNGRMHQNSNYQSDSDRRRDHQGGQQTWTSKGFLGILY